jgi:hypothetical protein
LRGRNAAAAIHLRASQESKRFFLKKRSKKRLRIRVEGLFNSTVIGRVSASVTRLLYRHPVLLTKALPFRN